MLGKSNVRMQNNGVVMELRYRDAAIADLQSFIMHYEDAFFELYRDSGLWNEDAIIQNVRQSATALFDDLFAHIQSQLLLPRILGRKRLHKGWQEICFRLGTRLVIVYYSEEGKRVRWIESIMIDRKPIIF